MSELEDLINDIETLRNNLNKLIASKQENLQDSDVVSASYILNAAITKYNELIKKKLES